MSTIRPNPELLRQVEQDSGVNASACYGCKKCSNGCPVTFAMDYHPYQVVRLVQFGQIEKLKESRTIWICASCQTCLTRCPNDVDLPRLMDHLKEVVSREGRPALEDKVKLFHELFLGEVKTRGRVFEAGLMARYMLKSGGAFGPDAFKNALLGLSMLRRGRLKLLPEGVSDRGWLKDLFEEWPPAG